MKDWKIEEASKQNYPDSLDLPSGLCGCGCLMTVGEEINVGQCSVCMRREYEGELGTTPQTQNPPRQGPSISQEDPPAVATPDLASGEEAGDVRDADGAGEKVTKYGNLRYHHFD